MAVLSDAGVHCSVATCGQRDFLPFTCDCCKQVFCLDHFRYEAHNCKQAAGKDNRVLVCPLCQQGVKLVQGEDPNLTWERHMRQGCAGGAGTGGAGKKNRCPVKGCKEELTFSNRVQCGKCGLATCLKHRFEEDHQCAGAGSRAPTAAPILADVRSASARQQQQQQQQPRPAAAGATGGQWACPRCTLVNAPQLTTCGACGAARPPPEARSAAPVAASGGTGWKCQRCTLDNNARSTQCEACGAARPASNGSACIVQ